MKLRLIAVLLVGVLMAAAGDAQPYGTDILATTTAGVLYRIAPNGGWQVIVSFRSLPNMVAMHNNNRDAVVATYQTPNELLVVDVQQNAIVRTILSGGPLFRHDYFTPLHDGDFAVTGTAPPFQGALIKVRPDGSGATTIHVGAPFRGPQAVIQDLNTGHILMGDLTGQTLYDVAFDGTITTVWISAMNFPFSMTQDHTDGTILLGNGGRSWLYGFHRLDRFTQRMTTVVQPSVVNNANAICFDRWLGTGEIIVGSGPVHRIDGRKGTVITTYAGLPWNNTGMCFEQGRNIVTIRVSRPNQWRFDLNFPGEGGRRYLLALSFTGFRPGIPVDSRVIPLFPDTLFGLSVTGGLAPYLQNGFGILDPKDRASAALDLRSFGNLLSGIPVWAAAVTIDRNAPSSMATISKPVVLVLD